MRLNYNTIAQQPYNYVGNISVIKKNDGGYLLPLSFDWLNTYLGAPGNQPVTGGYVRIDLTQADFSAGEDIQWRTVYIDNSQVPYPLELLFPDTGQSIVCKPFSEKTARVYSNSNYAILYFIYDNGSGSGSTNVSIRNMTFMCFDTGDYSPSSDNLQLKLSSTTKALEIDTLADTLLGGNLSLATVANTITNLTTNLNDNITYNNQSQHVFILNAYRFDFATTGAGTIVPNFDLVLRQSPPNITINTFGSWLGAIVGPGAIEVTEMYGINNRFVITGTGAVTLAILNRTNVTGSLNYSIAYTLATYP